MAFDATIKFRALRFCQRQRVRFQAFPHRIQEVSLLLGRKGLHLISQVAHCVENNADSVLWQAGGLWARIPSAPPNYLFQNFGGK